MRKIYCAAVTLDRSAQGGAPLREGRGAGETQCRFSRHPPRGPREISLYVEPLFELPRKAGRWTNLTKIPRHEEAAAKSGVAPRTVGAGLQMQKHGRHEQIAQRAVDEF